MVLGASCVPSNPDWLLSAIAWMLFWVSWTKLQDLIVFISGLAIGYMYRDFFLQRFENTGRQSDNPATESIFLNAPAPTVAFQRDVTEPVAPATAPLQDQDNATTVPVHVPQTPVVRSCPCPTPNDPVEGWKLRNIGPKTFLSPGESIHSPNGRWCFRNESGLPWSENLVHIAVPDGTLYETPENLVPRFVYGTGRYADTGTKRYIVLQPNGCLRVVDDLTRSHWKANFTPPANEVNPVYELWLPDDGYLVLVRWEASDTGNGDGRWKQVWRAQRAWWNVGFEFH
ncbi:hypothetical protein M427DRAFT_51113 [Gonapodya prolifera JEL478]|uniref:Uncharacterized protein n=1 Tax=Gonapodya prolifera (strain JEL478) TaxID=1344416 RepID=A0A139AYE5_GONPJ|nr:hypothetical protein M427DRAFT_51113 [Gonapodya prolifera JEL478]|eukprot:KXS21734.1 hypothetical protein M427DRAFT_51113 [Gonapodya prolifera JEL478]